MNMEARKKAAITPSEISPAAELIANNDDLLTLILVRLPAKSTIRFKSVSKHWHSLLSDSVFARNHYSRNPTKSISGLYLYIHETLNSVSLHGRHQNLPSLSFLYGITEPSRIEVTHSSHGLLLCSIGLLYDYGYGWRYIVCNPSTRKYTILYPPGGSIKGRSAYLAFDPSKSPHLYKVVLASYHPHRIDVYRSQSSSWKTFFPQQRYDGPSVFWNGAVHWLTSNRFLMRFDVDAEEIIAMPNPRSPKILSLNNIMYFGECGGGLILIQSRLPCPRGFRILELERDYSRWVVKCQVNLRPLINEFPEIDKGRSNILSIGYKVMFALEGESEKDFAIVLAIPGRLVSYNLKCKTWDVLHDPGESNEISSYRYACTFVDTLYPV